MESNRKRRKYVPGLAQLGFKVELDWSSEQARRMQHDSICSVERNNIIYDDCIDGMNEMPDDSVDLIIADPPFGIDFSGKEGQYNRKAENVVDGYIEIQEPYEDFSLKWIQLLFKILKPTGSAYIVSGWTNLGDILIAIKKSGLILLNHIIWKYQFGVFTKRKFVTSHYHILFVAKDDGKYFFNKFEHYPEDVWDIPRVYKPGQLKNGTKLPEDLIIRMIQFSSKPGDLVFDPFMGNATSAVCAKGLFRNFFGFELNKNMKPIHDQNLQAITPGEYYLPLNETLPSHQELLRKYPHLKKFVP